MENAFVGLAWFEVEEDHGQRSNRDLSAGSGCDDFDAAMSGTPGAHGWTLLEGFQRTQRDP
jgi:hypothetical protein